MHGIRFDCLRAHAERLDRANRVRLANPDVTERLLSAPRPCLVLDLETIRPGGLPRSIQVRRTVEAAGYRRTWRHEAAARPIRRAS